MDCVIHWDFRFEGISLVDDKNQKFTRETFKTYIERLSLFTFSSINNLASLIFSTKELLIRTKILDHPWIKPRHQSIWHCPKATDFTTSQRKALRYVVYAVYWAKLTNAKIVSHAIMHPINTVIIVKICTLIRWKFGLNHWFGSLQLVDIPLRSPEIDKSLSQITAQPTYGKPLCRPFPIVQLIHFRWCIRF